MLKEDISIIIVNYKSVYDIELFLGSFKKIQSSKTFKFYIYNNDLSESIVLEQVFKKFDFLFYIYNSNNVGFGAAVNHMAEIVNSEYILIVNPDCLIVDYDFDNFFKEYKLQSNIYNLAFFAPILVDSNKKIYVCYGEYPSLKEVFFRKFYLHILFKTYYKKYLSIGKEFIYTQPKEVPYPCGAFLLIDRNLFLKFNGFNKRYFAYFEETDLAYEFKKNGFFNMITPNYKVIHHRGNRKLKSINNQLFIKSQYLYFLSHGMSIHLLFLLNIISLILRFPFYGFDVFINQLRFNINSYTSVRKSY
jgi:GT2 family glycosyltransferase